MVETKSAGLCVLFLVQATDPGEDQQNPMFEMLIFDFCWVHHLYRSLGNMHRFPLASGYDLWCLSGTGEVPPGGMAMENLWLWGTRELGAPKV